MLKINQIFSLKVEKEFDEKRWADKKFPARKLSIGGALGFRDNFPLREIQRFEERTIHRKRERTKQIIRQKDKEKERNKDTEKQKKDTEKEKKKKKDTEK